MWKIGLATTSALALIVAGTALARADDISAKKLSIKDASPAKRQLQVQSSDGGVTLSGADDPGTNGAAIHVYSATDDFCAILPAGAGWQHKNSGWKYKSKATKASAQVGDGKLSVKLKSGVTYTLGDNGTQGTVNVQVQFGTGTRYCMKCVTAKKNTAKKYQAKACAPAACDPEPSVCNPSASTTTTTVTGTSTTTSNCPSTPGTVLKGALTATPGRFNYNLTLGLPGANAACNTNFPGTHACTYQELQNAAEAGDLACLKDIGANTVTSFWAIDNSHPPLQQCQDDVSSFQNWEYATAHTSSRGQKVPLNNAAGTLGSLQSGLQCNLSGNSWVGCCQ
jgi:hypothetical protein